MCYMYYATYMYTNPLTDITSLPIYLTYDYFYT